MNKFKTWLHKPFPIWEYTTSRKLLIILLIEVFSVGFKFVYKPFEMNIPEELRFAFFGGHALINVLVLAFQYFLLPIISFGYFADQTRTVFKQVLWILILFVLLTIAHASYIVDENIYLIVPNMIFDSFYVNIAIGIFPIMLILLLAHIKQLSDKLKDVELYKSEQSEFEYQNEMIEIVSDSGNELLKIELINLLYIKSSDNYSEIYYLEEKEIKKKIIRTALTSLEENIKCSYLFRTHRSFIVNFLNIDSVTGNANKCEVLLKHPNEKIPVSRTKRQEMLDQLSKLPISYKV